MKENVNRIIASRPDPEEYEQGVITEIIPGKLYLGDCLVAMDAGRLRDKGITRIINVTDDIACFFPDQFLYMKISIDDYDDTPIENYFEDVYKFIKENDSGATLVHCRAGISRSSTMVIMYIGKSRRLKFVEAYEYVHNKRPFISPNYGFCCKLIEYLG